MHFYFLFFILIYYRLLPKQKRPRPQSKLKPEFTYGQNIKYIKKNKKYKYIHMSINQDLKYNLRGGKK